MFADQSGFQVRFDWGDRGIDAQGPGSGLIILVDVLSFSTCVDVATSRGAVVFPCLWNDERADNLAAEHEAVLATKQRRASGGYSLSPQSLAEIPPGTRLVLPSPNGATLSLLAARFAPTATACLRNAEAVATAARLRAQTVTVIGCGERWPDGNLRFAWEDLVGAGAVIAHLPGERSPEAQAAADAFRMAAPMLSKHLRNCASGRELIERGFEADLDWAGSLGASRSVPFLQDGCYTALDELQIHHQTV